jgi:hypothetical protein
MHGEQHAESVRPAWMHGEQHAESVRPAWMHGEQHAERATRGAQKKPPFVRDRLRFGVGSYPPFFLANIQVYDTIESNV